MVNPHIPPERGSGAGPAFDRRHTSGLRLGALPGAVSCGRLHLREVCWEWHLPGVAEDAELIASELLTNAVTASHKPTGPVPAVWLRLFTDGAGLLIEVGDHSAGEPQLTHSDGDAIGGRGLVLVDALSSRWGFYFVGYARKVVWAIIEK
jgi:anti-sigma regulatory factor (Ser/Thr protein kinase)